MTEHPPRAGVHYPRSAGEFQSWFATDEDCLDYLAWLRWPKGFVCPRCEDLGGWVVADGSYKCASCKAQTAVTAGTLFDRRRTPLTVWFEGRLAPPLRHCAHRAGCHGDHRRMVWLPRHRQARLHPRTAQSASRWRTRGGRRGTAAGRPPDRIPRQAVEPRDPSRSRRRCALAELPRRIHLPVQPAPIGKPGDGLLPATPAGRRP